MVLTSLPTGPLQTPLQHSILMTWSGSTSWPWHWRCNHSVDKWTEVLPGNFCSQYCWYPVLCITHFPTVLSEGPQQDGARLAHDVSLLTDGNCSAFPISLPALTPVRPKFISQINSPGPRNHLTVFCHEISEVRSSVFTFSFHSSAAPSSHFRTLTCRYYFMLLWKLPFRFRFVALATCGPKPRVFTSSTFSELIQAMGEFWRKLDPHLHHPTNLCLPFISKCVHIFRHHFSLLSGFQFLYLLLDHTCPYLSSCFLIHFLQAALLYTGEILDVHKVN